MAGEETQTKDFLGMSDEDFLNINGPGAAPAASVDGGNTTTEEGAAAEGETTTTEIQANEGDNGEAAAAADNAGEAGEPDAGAAASDPARDADADKTGADPAAAAADKDGKAAVADPKADSKPKTEAEKKAAADKAAADKAAGKDPADKTEADKVQVETKAVDYEGFFKKVMAPFKANGRTIELKTPDEAIRLMQMGAGYGRKLQDLQPALKTLKMLEKAELLDEGKLSFLIEINNGNQEAIKKLIADKGLDPLDLNIGDNANYTPKSHSVSDKEMAFSDALKDVETSEGGEETLRIVNQTWDQESKSALWDQPEILKHIQTQRANGIYAKIVAEMDRQKLLGDIPSNTPFLKAYKLAGDTLFPPASVQTQPAPKPQPQVIATRTAAPKPQVQNGAKAAAAASTKTTTQRRAATTVNPLEMADDDFLKQFNGRL